jgi:hypothetical protein
MSISAVTFACAPELAFALTWGCANLAGRLEDYFPLSYQSKPASVLVAGAERSISRSGNLPLSAINFIT